MEAIEIQKRLDYFNKTRDWSVFDDIPYDQQVSVMYPEYMFGFRAEEVRLSTDPRLK